MRYYCTLLVRSNSSRTASSVFRREAVEVLELEDFQSPAHLERAARWRNTKSPAQFVVRNDLPRYCWSLSSLKAVEPTDSDPAAHISWLLSQLKSGTSLIDAQKKGAECLLNFYWSGQGTGGGPVIVPKLAELLCLYGVNLQIGFYFSND